jgi:iron complex outermembrane recepter protein
MIGRLTRSEISVAERRPAAGPRTTLLAAVIGAVLMTASAASWGDAAIEEIIVTAQRRAENVQDVPVAISAFTPGDLDRAGVRQAGDIATMVPNFVVASPYGSEAMPVFSLRGVTSNDFSQNQSAPVAMYVDDVYKGVGALQALQTFDLDRVEVLRGPQGTIYGKNATGGAISFFSRNPDLHAYDGYVDVGVGNYSGRTVEGAVGGPISDGTLGWRAAVYYDKRDGWLDSITPGVAPANGVDALAGRLTLLAKPSDELTAQLKFSFSRSRGTPYGVRPANILPDVTGNNPNISFFQNASLYAYDKIIDNDGVSLKLDWKIAPHAMLTSVTAYDFGRWQEVGDDASVGTQIWGADTYASSVNAYSEELRIASQDTGRWTWLAGGYFGHDVVHGWNEYHYFDAYPGTVYVPGSSSPLYGFDQANSFDQVRQSSAVFGNASFDVTPDVTLSAGVRYTRDSLAVKNFFALEGGLPSAPTFPGLGQPTLWTQTIPYIDTTFVNFQPGVAPQSATLPERGVDNTNVSYKVGVDWKPAPGMLSYLTVSRGYRGAAFNSQAFNDPVEVNFASPEELTSYELGFKSELLERRMQLNAALFYYDYKNQQFLGTSSANGVLLYQEVNAPKSRVEGGEVELRAKVTSDLELRANVGVQDSKYIDFVIHGVDVAGNQLAMSPNLTLGGVVDWRVGSLFGGIFRVSADANYVAKQYFDPQNTERIAQGGYTVLNARAMLTLGTSNQYSVSLWGKNLANKGYVAYALATQQPSQGGLGLDYTVPAEPRTYGLLFTVHF